MALPTGTAGVFAPVNIAGLLFAKTDTRTPLFNMIGGMQTGSREFLTGAEYELGSASQPAISETASLTAPTPTFTERTNAKNVTQIFERSVAVTYRKSSDVDTLTGLNLAGQSNNVPSEFDFQLANRLAEIRNDMEYTILNGVYNLAATADEADKTRGLNAAITTNVLDAQGEELNPDLLIKVARMLATYSPYGADGVVGILNAEQVVQLNKIILNEGQRVSMASAGTDGMIEYRTPFGVLRFMSGGHRYQPNGVLTFARLNLCSNVLQPVPGKGNFFYEPLAKTGAAEKGYVYGQWGFNHGNEYLHAKIVNLATTTTASPKAPAVVLINDASAPVYTSAI